MPISLGERQLPCDIGVDREGLNDFGVEELGGTFLKALMVQNRIDSLDQSFFIGL